MGWEVEGGGPGVEMTMLIISSRTSRGMDKRLIIERRADFEIGWEK